MSVHKNFINIINEDLKELVDNIINLDYNTLLEIFQILKILRLIYLNETCNYFSKMRKISESYTIIIKK